MIFTGVTVANVLMIIAIVLMAVLISLRRSNMQINFIYVAVVVVVSVVKKKNNRSNLLSDKTKYYLNDFLNDTTVSTFYIVVTTCRRKLHRTEITINIICKPKHFYLFTNYTYITTSITISRES